MLLSFKRWVALIMRRKVATSKGFVFLGKVEEEVDVFVRNAD